ncbi:unnamed protein product, partial [Scytosiphon promiscuus]
VQSKRSGTRLSSRIKQQQKDAPLVVGDSSTSDEERMEVLCLTEAAAAGGSGGNAADLASDTDDDDSGETPLLLGRGWSARQRERAKQRKLEKERGTAGGGRGGSAVVARRGKKRQRPLPSYPDDDVFRDRKYAADEGDGGDRPLTLHRVHTEGGSRSFWRWPPPPIPITARRDDSTATSPGSRGGWGGDANGGTRARSGGRLDFSGGAGTSVLEEA